MKAIAIVTTAMLLAFGSFAQSDRATARIMASDGTNYDVKASTVRIGGGSSVKVCVGTSTEKTVPLGNLVRFDKLGEWGSGCSGTGPKGSVWYSTSGNNEEVVFLTRPTAAVTGIGVDDGAKVSIPFDSITGIMFF